MAEGPNVQFPMVEPLYEPEEGNAPGPFYVIKGICILCAVPPETAPQNIKWDEAYQSGCTECPTNCRIAKQPETPREIEQVIKAASQSCIEAIRYCGTDPAVLARFQELGMGGYCDALHPSRQSKNS